MALRLQAIFAGRGALLLRCAEEWLSRGHAIDALVSDEAGARIWAGERGLPAHSGLSPGASAALPDTDFHFLVGHPEDTPGAGLRAPRRRVIAFQDSLLPAYAGWHATSWAILHREALHGITWFAPDSAGALPLQRVEVPLAADETAFSLDAKCFDAAVSGFTRLVMDLENERETIQPALNVTASFFAAHQRPPGAGLLLFTRPAAELAALARALDFAGHANPLCLPKLWLGRAAVVAAEVEAASAPAGAAPGAIIAWDAQGMTVAAGEGAVILRRLATCSGSPVSPVHLAEQGGWRPGFVLPVPAAEQVAAATAMHEKLARHEAFWAQRLADVQPYVLPFARPASDSVPAWATVALDVPGAPWPAATLLAAQAAFLLRIADAREADVEWHVGSGRDGAAGLEALVASAVPLHLESDDGDTLDRFGERLSAQVAALQEHASYAADLVARQPGLRDRAARSAVQLAMGPLAEDPDGEAVLRIEVAADGASCTWRFNERAWPRERARQLADLAVEFLRNVRARPGAPWRAGALVGDVERRRLLDLLVGEIRPYPLDRDLGELVEEAARRTPDAPAIVSGDEVLTYRSFLQQANRMAALLKARGAMPDTRIGLYMDRSPEAMVALLGVIKAGACYVPIDPAYPRERVLYMMENAQMALLLTQPHLKDALPSAGREVVVVDARFDALRDQPDQAPAGGAGPDHLGYVIYTSGSTGAPKGVAMTRRALMNLVAWQNGVSTPGPAARTFQYASLSFDVSFQEMFSTWTSGGALVLVPEDARRDPLRLLRLARASGVQRWFMPYAALQRVAAAAEAAQDHPPALRDVIAAGEALRITPEIRRLFQHLPSCRLHNHYGPSETHVATAFVLPADVASWPELPPIGRPLANTRLALLDAGGDAVPEGFPGELLIGGDCLARGYLLQPELTAERFVLKAWPGGSPQRFYRTGDLARLAPDGQLEFLGRRDDQVKIRGYRVELGEVEAALSRHPQVRECAVVARERDGARQLSAFVVVRDPACGTRELRAHLQGILPDYMVPSAFVFLDRLPLTPSGKIHRRALPEPTVARPAMEATYRPPQSDVERILGHLWQQVLGVDRVGTADNFFDLGGDSLKLAKVQAALRTSLRREVPILDLFRYPTIAALAGHLAPSAAAPPAARRRARATTDGESIAVVGMAGRFPGAADIEQLWARLCAGDEMISFFADDEVAGTPPNLDAGSGLKFIKARGVLDRCEMFDAGLFGYGPRDAELMDPQHRVFLECAWEALEHAGLDPARFGGAIGVYAAASMNTYLMYNVLGNRAAVADFMTAYQVGGYPTVIGNDKDYVATRVAYKLNLRGPSMSIQTACSSSLVAVCQACQGLVAGACDVALAGGVSITFPQKRGYLYVEGSIASSDGHCRPFDASATGTVFGSGAGIVVLKRLADAQADGDTVYAVLKGWALNNDGAMKAGFMAPSAEGQAEVIRMAQERAGVEARTIGYVEAHGTGTPLGDPIEVAGLTRAFRLSTPDAGFCALGSVKANIGHLESAAGVTGLIKAVLALHRAQIPPLVHFVRPNPLLELPGTPFYATNRLLPWPATQAPRRAAVSSFGVGGTNAHVVLEEAPAVDAGAVEKPAHLLLLSARTESALKASAANLADFLERRGEGPLGPVGYTLQTGRQAMERRAFVVAGGPADAVTGLRVPGWLPSAKAPAVAPSVVFLFPGQGSQHVDMARGLYETEPVVRRHIDECAALLRPLLDLDLRELLYPDERRRQECQDLLTQTQYAQPALFVIEYALARWWMAMGVRPAAMIGHSAGEYVAASLLGVFSLEDALKVLVRRAQLMQAMPPGRMLAVRLSESDVQPYLGREISLAAANAPSMSVLSGPAPAMEELNRQFEAKGIGGRLLQTSHAFHSDMMTPALEPFRRAVGQVTLGTPSAPFLSTVRGGWLEPGEVQDPAYWVRQIREPVRFSRAVREAQKKPGAVFLEVGPNQALTTLALQHDAPDAPLVAIPSLRHARESVSDYASLLRALGRLWSAGQACEWEALYEGRPPRRVALPTYPFERKRYWIDPPAAEDAASPARPPARPEPEGGDGSAEAAAPAPTAVPAAGQDAVLSEVLDILQDLSGIERSTIVPQRPFLEMGFDSLFLTQVSLAFQKRFLVKLTLRQMLDDLSSPAAIAGYLSSRMPAPTAAAPMAEAPAPAGDPLSLAQAGPFGPEVQASAAAAPAPARHGPFAPINKSAGEALTPRQQQALRALVDRYTKKTARSKAHTQEHRAHFADPRAVAGFRVAWKEMTYPVVSSRSEGAKIWDLDGNEFLDVTMGFGTNLFGHNPGFVRQAVQEQLARGIEIGPQSAVAGEVARLVCDFTGFERATFCNTGSEAVMGAVRAARTVTGRSRIVYFAGDYHGVNDEVLAKGQTVQGRMRTVPIAPGIPPDMVSQVHVLPYGDAASLEWLRAQAGTLAAVLVEPVQSRRPELQPREFLQAVRDITRRAGTALIFDEVITGFRVHPGGAQAWFGVKADLATYGKIVGGGLPIGVIAGTRAYLDAFDGGCWQYGDASVPEAGVTFFAGTFVRHPLAMVAARAVLHHLREAGPGLQVALNDRTGRFAGEVNQFLDAEGIDLRINHFGSLWYFSHGDGFKHFSLLFHFLRDLGIHIWEGRPCFLSTAHSEDDVERLVAAFKQAIASMREGGFLPERVPAVPAAGAFPLSEAQQEIWLASRLDPEAAPAFNESCSLTFIGSFRADALTAALLRLVERHESLRTSVTASGEAQQVHPPIPPELAVEDLSALAPAERASRLAEGIRAEVRQPFDLARAPLLRGRLMKMSDREHVLALTAHHIICDGWSYDVMVRDLGELYSMACRGERDQRPLPAQFRDYARHMAAFRRDARYDADLGYWMEQLAAAPQAIQLPLDRPRPPLRSFSGAMEVARVEEPLLLAVKELGTRQRCTLFATLMAVYAVLLHRLSGQRDIIIGIPAAGQQVMEGQDLVGHCANLLPLRLRIEPDRPFAELLAAAQRALLDAYEHQGLTFGALLKALQLSRDPSRSPLIQVTFNVDPAIHGLQFEGLETEIVINPRSAYQFEHSLNIVAQPDGLRLECNYNTDLFDQATAARWLGHFREIARSVAQAPDTPVHAIPLLSDQERRAVLFDWNRTATPYPDRACIHELFEEGARAHPDRIALSLSGNTMSYEELNRQANQLARRLMALGAQPDQPVGICAERSLETVVGLLAILKSGGAYLPLDPAHPLDRLRHQIRDARPRIVLVQARHESLFRGEDVRCVSLDSPMADWRSMGGADLAPGERPRPFHSSQLAYVLYTSGSTGRPKGVLIEHRSVVRLVREAPFMTWGPDERMVHLSPLAFDASTLEIWGPLLNGGRVALLPPGPFTFDALARVLREEKITALWLTSSLFQRLVDEDPTCLAPVRQLLTGGEVVSGLRIARLLALRPDLKIINGYGPTECTTFATTETFTGADRVDDPPPLGRPISNTQVYILDDHLNPVPVGVAGELCIGGDGLARGYLNQPELTQRQFIPNPFPGTPGGRLYRTGDLARYRADGRIEFLGRRDDQVKIRGYRIEPGEIEAVLSGYPGLAACAVVPRLDAAGEKALTAYVAMAAGQPAPATEALRAHLRRTMPDFMVPATFVVQPDLPLTSSGKVDRRALPDPAAVRPASASGYEAPRTELEKRVADIWADILRLPRVGRCDDFFTLGGHSLAALSLINRLRDAGYELEVVDLFRHPTVEQVAQVLKPVAGEAPIAKADQVVIRLQAGRADLPPLCLLPSDFGDLLIYANLMPHLNPDQPCWGLQCPRMYEDDRGIASMPDLARFFVQHLRAVQPNGPYLLAGYCFGGLVALEMARQLKDAGQRVALLGLIDARPYRPAVARGEYLGMLVKGALRAKPADWRRHISARLGMKREGMLIDLMARMNPNQLGRRELNRWVLEKNVLQHYRSTEYAGPITYFYPEQSQYQLYGDPSCGWLYLADRVHMHKVTGSHLNMMKEPHVRLLAESLRTCIRQVVGT